MRMRHQGSVGWRGLFANALAALLMGVVLSPLSALAADPKAELDAAYAKLEALDGYRERITFNLQDMEEMGGAGEDGEDGEDGFGGFDMTAMMAPFKKGMVREVAKGGHSRLSFSMPNPSPAGKELQFELIDFGDRFATRYDDPAMRATGKAATLSVNAKMAADNAIAMARGAPTAAMNPFGMMDSAIGLGVAGAGMAAAASGKGQGDLGKWVCRKGEPEPDYTAKAKVEALPTGNIGGKAVKRYRVTPPPEVKEGSPHVVSVDEQSGLPVRVEVLDEDGEVFTTIEHSDFGKPQRIEFPKCDKNQ